MAHFSLPVTETPGSSGVDTTLRNRIGAEKVSFGYPNTHLNETSTDIFSGGFGIPSRHDTASVTLDKALAAERAILPLLVRAAVHSIDRDLIERGIAAGWVPSHNSAQPGEPNDIGIGWLRFRAACARTERTLYAQDDPMRRYLTHRAADSDAEANARARSMETMGRRRVA